MERGEEILSSRNSIVHDTKVWGNEQEVSVEVECVDIGAWRWHWTGVQGPSPKGLYVAWNAIDGAFQMSLTQHWKGSREEKHNVI